MKLKDNVGIITEGNKQVGFGHIGRCLSIYQAFLEKEINPCLIINGDESIKDFLEIKNYLILNWIKEKSRLYKLIENYQIIVIDSYLADYSIYKKIADTAKIPVYIDDTKRIDYPVGILINALLSANDLNYSKKDNLEYLLGPEYSMLKKEFWDVKIKEINKEINTMMISLGGNDIRNITPKILSIFNEKYPKLNKKVVIGKGFKNIPEIEMFEDNFCELIYYPNANGMIEVMMESDIAISSGGQTIIELSTIGVPTITISVSENQIGNVKSSEKLGLSLHAGWWTDADLYSNVLLHFKRLKNLELRKKINDLGRKLIKPDGSRKIIDHILKKL